MASISFHVTPAKLRLGESATLQWDIEGVQAIYLDGQGVTGHESRTVWPAATISYHLHIVLQDNTVTNRTVTVEVEGAPVSDGVVTRPATVALSPANQARLRQYPRPPRDNGRGLHFHLDLRDESIAKSVARLQYINATWTLIYAQDELQAKRAAQACWAAGIMPVVRIGKKIDEGFDAVEYVKALNSVGAPPYIQIYNEPGDRREWIEDRPSNYQAVFASRWVGHAIAVYEAGGYPGFQVMGKSELDAVFAAVAARGRHDIWERAFFVTHNYGGNHPPAYPYPGGRTAMDDQLTVLSFLAFAFWMQAHLGFVLPIIGGEGGWQYGNHDDQHYPKILQPLHAHYHHALFDWFRSGVLANGEPLPDYLFSVTPWILGGWHTSESWWESVEGTHTETIEAVRRLPPFLRQFSWERDPQGPIIAPPPPDEEEEGGDPPPAPPDPVPDWDPLLDQLGVRVQRATVSPAWRLVKAVYRDHTQSGNRHHVDLVARRADGTPAPGVQFVVDWVGRLPHENPGFVTTDGNGRGNYPIYNNLHPEYKDGTNFAALVNAPGDRVDGMGLPNKHHVSYELTYQFGP